MYLIDARILVKAMKLVLRTSTLSLHLMCFKISWPCVAIPIIVCNEQCVSADSIMSRVMPVVRHISSVTYEQTNILLVLFGGRENPFLFAVSVSVFVYVYSMHVCQIDFYVPLFCYCL